ncbi:TRAP transporter substrate-binding protein [Ferrovibrio sp.]|uniref:TRAP transporter substrate-binding protein n=1 Tax=Ferrovibrio sp. TaxID=1917215 RepID=UPI0025C2159A|nr:TRAP transporter substrate-binding protein [Ferrovibrio sp.]MBX3454997.1 TRAP transporter substrate-binding protein [Ferrovibrio sp.]
MVRVFLIAVGMFFVGLTLGLGYMTVRNATPIPAVQTERSLPVAQVEAPDMPMQLRMASSYASGSPLLGSLGVSTTQRIAQFTDSKVDLKFHEPGALAPANEVLNAVASGEVDAGWTSASYWVEKDSAFAFFVGLPFGPRAAEYLAWLHHGGGQQLMTELFTANNIVPVACGLLPAEGGGWFRKEINSVDDLRGQKIRIIGLGGEVLRKLGANTVLAPGGEVFLGLQNGSLDGAEFSVPAIDLRVGFYKVAPNYYLPGWHQPLTIHLLAFNPTVWEKMSDRQREAVGTVCAANLQDSLADGEAAQPAALTALRKKGANIRPWSPELMSAFETTWRKVVAEQNAANPNFRRVWESYAAFRDGYAEWRQLGYLR